VKLLALLVRHRFALAVIALGAFLHLYRLDVWPSPAGDEMNWFLMGVDVHEGRTPHLSEAGAFVPALFAYVVGAGFAGGSVDWWHARIVVAVAIVLLAIVAYAMCMLAGRPRAALFLLAWRLLAPWSLAWSRTTSVPYALATAIGTVGAIAFFMAIDARSSVRRAVGIVVSTQLLVLAFCGSPLAGLWAVGAGIVLLIHRDRRALLLSPGPAVALVLALVEVVPIVRGALKVAAAHGATWTGVTSYVGERTWNYLTAIADGLDGMATIQHFAWGRCASPAPSTVIFAATRLATCALLALAIHSCVRRTARSADPWGLRGAIMFGVAIVGTPVLLAPARDWGLGTIDTDRYAFAWSLPAALIVGALAEVAPRRGRLVPAIVSTWIVGPGSALWTLWQVNASIDCGVARADGGAWRGVQVAEGPRSIPEWLADATVRASPDGSLPLVVDDFFGLRAVEISLRARGAKNAVVFPKHGDGGEPLLPEGPFLVAMWPPSRFAPGMHWGNDVANTRLRASMPGRETKLVAAAKQPGGAPLLELWEVRGAR
jgi:hypothetical protein